MVDNECFSLDIDEIEEYTSCVLAEEKMQHTMALYKRQMFDANKSRDRHRYEQVRMHADILAKSLAHVQKRKEKHEKDVMTAFESARPGLDEDARPSEPGDGMDPSSGDGMDPSSGDGMDPSSGDGMDPSSGDLS